jgi:hypothetical protein
MGLRQRDEPRVPKFIVAPDDCCTGPRHPGRISIQEVRDMEQKTVRIAAGFGAAYVVIGVAGSGGKGDPSAPSLGASGESIAAYAAAHSLAPVMVGQLFEILSLLALLVFAAALYAILRRAESEPGPLPVLALSGGLLAVGLKLGSFMPAFALHYHSTPIDPAVARALFEMNNFGFVLMWFGQAVLLGSVAIAGLAWRAIPRWLAAPAALIAVALVVDAAFASGPNLSFVPELLWLLWVLVASVRLTIRPAAYQAKQAASARAA